jgi:DMSO/TMAO reductase YedYZ molybdopterin-dependent catalytic subunit
MEPDRFDDVESTILEAPAPRERNPLRRRVALVMAVGLVLAGGMAAGADALTNGGTQSTSAAPKATQGEGWMRYTRDGHPCRRGEHHRSSTSELRY